jgi:hypothetical protein
MKTAVFGPEIAHMQARLPERWTGQDGADKPPSSERCLRHEYSV